MKFSKALVATAALIAVAGAQAQVTGALAGSGGSSFLSLSSAGLTNGSVATLAGGSVYDADKSYAAIPMGTVGSFLAAGDIAGSLATLSFTGPGVSAVSFLWGSPDAYNMLGVTTTGNVTTSFDTTKLAFAVSNGNQGFAQYVNFTATGGSLITGLSFSNPQGYNAFEVSNFNVTAVPEPQTYALMLAGLGAVCFLARRRKA